jgi:hypothetical protein
MLSGPDCNGENELAVTTAAPALVDAHFGVAGTDAFTPVVCRLQDTTSVSTATAVATCRTVLAGLDRFSLRAF